MEKTQIMCDGVQHLAKSKLFCGKVIYNVPKVQFLDKVVLDEKYCQIG